MAAKSKRLGVSPWWAVLFIGPALLGMTVFYYYPAIRTFWLSFTTASVFGTDVKFVGLDNYLELFSNSELWLAFRNTLIYSSLSLLVIPLATIIAVLLNTKGLKGIGVYRTLYFLPVVTLPAVVAIVWRYMYNGDFGILNQVLGLVGIHGGSWLTNPHTVMFAIVTVGIWMALGTNIVILLAGLQAIPDTSLEAAKMDGAGPIRTFFSITVPLLSPSLFLTSVLAVIAGLQMFDLIYLLGGSAGTPGYDESVTLVSLFYKVAFADNRTGAAAAIGLVLMLFILALTAFQFRMQKKWVHYE
ncbi:MAG TPA: sugar ABC transporter permease [Candidatus Lumbricidophila sp.]|nr:sugar ABC transporter permease [Candidatus Lumbricidophila sp.]